MSRAEDDAIAAELAKVPAPKAAKRAPTPKAPPQPSLADAAQQAANWIERAQRDWVKIPQGMKTQAKELLPELNAAIARAKPKTAPPKPVLRGARR